MDTTHQRVSKGFGFRADFRVYAPLIGLGWWLAWAFQDSFISDWDGFDYTAYTVQGLPSALGLGRALFLGYNHLLWKILSHQELLLPENAYLQLRYGSILLSGPAVAGLYALGKELTGSRLAALLGGLILAFSPYFVLYSGRSMSEIPGFFLLNWSLWWMVKSLREGSGRLFLLAAILIGLSANVREFAIFYLPFIPIAAHLYGFRWRKGILAAGLAAVSALSGLGFWVMKRGDLYLGTVLTWYRLSARERELNPVTLQNFGFFGDYSYNCSVAVVFLAPVSLTLLWIYREQRALLWLGLWGLLADIALIANHDLSLNPRYLLTGMVGLAPVCGWGLARMFQREWWRGAAMAAGVVVLTLVNFIQLSADVYWQQRNSTAAAAYLRRIESFPWNSAFIVGARSPLINYYAGIEARPWWKTISPGSGWPDEQLGAVIEDLRFAGRPIFIDFDPEIWQSGAREHSREAAGLTMIRQCYQLQHVQDQLFRIVGPSCQR